MNFIPTKKRSQWFRSHSENSETANLIMSQLRGFIERIVGSTLWDSYSFGMQYTKQSNNTMEGHFDTSENPVSLTFCIHSSESVAKNPICIDKARFSNPLSSRVTISDISDLDNNFIDRIDLKVGDLCMFRGREHLHWRENTDSNTYAAVLCHYLDYSISDSDGRLTRPHKNYTRMIPRISKRRLRLKNYTEFKNKSIIVEGSVSANKQLELKIREPELWSPDNPNLYDLKLTLTNLKGKKIDQIDSYFGMRKISLGDHKGVKYLFLNNKPLFHYGTLDQGWWPDGLLTPPSDEAMRYDIEITKAMGFNMIRKHVKIEPDRWYYHCDKLGILVWQDMPSGGKMVEKINGPTTNKRGDKKYYTNLQHVGRTGADLNKNADESIQFEKELRKMINIHYNSPSIVIWVPFNEGWGQYDTCRISDLVKGLDATRLVIPTSGWSLRNCGDIYDIHTYEVELKTPIYHNDRATVIGEFGGIGFPIKKNLWNPEIINWGYQTYNTQENLQKSYEYKFNQIRQMKEKHGLSGAVYTQTTDVEGEVNGLLTYDREVIKIPAKILNEMHSPLYKE